MAGVGLSGDALEAWLEEWMKLISADVSEMAQGGIGSTIPASRAAELLVERRLGTAVAAIAGKCMLLHMIWLATLLHAGPRAILPALMAATCCTMQALGVACTPANRPI